MLQRYTLIWTWSHILTTLYNCVCMHYVCLVYLVKTESNPLGVIVQHFSLSVCESRSGSLCYQLISPINRREHAWSSGKVQDSWSLAHQYCEFEPRYGQRVCVPGQAFLISICFVDQSVSGTCRLWGILQNQSVDRACSLTGCKSS